MPPAPCNLEVRFDAVVPLRGEIFAIPLDNRTVEALVMRTCQTLSKPGRTRTHWDFRRTLCRRNLDAVDFEGRGSLRRSRRDRIPAPVSPLPKSYVGRPSPLYFAERLTAALGGAGIYLKREDLNHTGSHKINNCVGQALLAERMGKSRVIAETGAGQHGVATATVCALISLRHLHGSGRRGATGPQCLPMKMLGADVRPPVPPP